MTFVGITHQGCRAQQKIAYNSTEEGKILKGDVHGGRV